MRQTFWRMKRTKRFMQSRRLSFQNPASPCEQKTSYSNLARTSLAKPFRPTCTRTAGRSITVNSSAWTTTNGWLIFLIRLLPRADVNFRKSLPSVFLYIGISLTLQQTSMSSSRKSFARTRGLHLQMRRNPHKLDRRAMCWL
jgi:hypothetical protein